MFLNTKSLDWTYCVELLLIINVGFSYFFSKYNFFYCVALVSTFCFSFRLLHFPLSEVLFPLFFAFSRAFAQSLGFFLRITCLWSRLRGFSPFRLLLFSRVVTDAMQPTSLFSFFICCCCRHLRKVSMICSKPPAITPQISTKTNAFRFSVSQIV